VHCRLSAPVTFVLYGVLLALVGLACTPMSAAAAQADTPTVAASDWQKRFTQAIDAIRGRRERGKTGLSQSSETGVSIVPVRASGFRIEASGTVIRPLDGDAVTTHHRHEPGY
jgi:hypothetical protein